MIKVLHNKFLPVDKMAELEDWIDSLPKEIIDHLDDDDLPEKLKLKVEYVDNDELPTDTEAELRPIEDKSYNGLIRISDKNRKTRFPYMHEIIHYLKDVGVDNRVERVFARKVTGKTESIDEQHVNYLTAASVMRYQEVKKKLIEYDKKRPKMDELAFVEALCKEYNQERVAVIRRIGEVRRLYKWRSR